MNDIKAPEPQPDIKAPRLQPDNPSIYSNAVLGYASVYYVPEEAEVALAEADLPNNDDWLQPAPDSDPTESSRIIYAGEDQDYEITSADLSDLDAFIAKRKEVLIGALKGTTEFSYDGLSGLAVYCLKQLAAFIEGEPDDLDLDEEDFSGADLSSAYLEGADIKGANFKGANLEGANLMNADLTGANLHNAYVADCSMSGAVLADADLTGCNLSMTHMDGAKLAGAKMDDINAVRRLVGGSDIVPSEAEAEAEAEA